MTHHWSFEFDLLRAKGVSLDVGLSEDDMLVIEQENLFRFPDDLRSLLLDALPIGDGFPDWPRLRKDEISKWLNIPYDGIAFDIENNAFWMEEWGTKPIELSHALAVARRACDSAPKLIPIMGHRFIPSEPSQSGNPIFSVHQTDIIYYGLDLHRYIACEFGSLDYRSATQGSARHIRFWSDLIDAHM